MGKRGGWFSAVRRALISDPRDKKDQPRKSKKRWFGRYAPADHALYSGERDADMATPPPTLPPPLSPRLSEDLKWHDAEDDQSQHAYSVALATEAAAEAPVVAAKAAAEVVRHTSVSRFPGKSKEEAAAIRIQSVFRGYMARRALRALRGLVRLKALIKGQSVKRQATTTLQCMQTLARIQSQIRARRIRMSEENRALQRQLQQHQEKEMNKMTLGEEWSNSGKSREEIEKNLIHRQEAAMRRERALAYAFSHQKAFKNSKSPNPTFIDPTNPNWGWSWLDRWMAARPWEARSANDSTDRASIKSAAYSSRPSPTSQKLRRPQTSSLAPSTPSTKAPRMRHFSPSESNWGRGDEDSRSIFSMQSEQPYFRRHSMDPLTMRDDQSLASSPSVPSYMAPTKSTKARSRLSSPSLLELVRCGSSSEKGSVVAGPTVKKCLSFQGSPSGNRRHSVPPKVGLHGKGSLN